MAVKLNESINKLESGLVSGFKIYDEFEEEYSTLYQIATNLNNLQTKGTLLIARGQLYYYKANFQSAFECYLEANLLYEKAKNINKQIDTYIQSYGCLLYEI